MPLKTFKPTTPSQRHSVLLDNSILSGDKPHKPLLQGMNKQAGRNSRGKITVRHRGGGAKRKYRIIDFKRDKTDMKATVETIEYDPNRTANISLVKYDDGERRYILSPKGLKVGDQIQNNDTEVPIKPGNTSMLKNIPAGTMVHNVELEAGKGGQLGRSAGTAILIMGGDKDYIQLKMPSGEIRLVREDCKATIGEIGNADNANVKLGKAGRSRNRGKRPGVRGVAMSAKHPHGGGQGKSGRHGPGGPAKDRWGNRVGTKTRKNKRTSKYIVKRKQSKKRKAKSYKTII